MACIRKVKGPKYTSRNKKRRCTNSFSKQKGPYYASSPDSEIVASYMKRFDYRPELSKEILGRYVKITGTIHN